MPATTEFTLLTEDRPGTLGKISRALGDRGVNILGFQSFPIGGKSAVRFVVDKPATARTVLDAEALPRYEADVAQIRLPHRPGELARAASRLGAADININYAYAGLEPESNAPLVFFGVADAARAAAILDEATAAAGA